MRRMIDELALKQIQPADQGRIDSECRGNQVDHGMATVHRTRGKGLIPRPMFLTTDTLFDVS